MMGGVESILDAADANCSGGAIWAARQVVLLKCCRAGIRPFAQACLDKALGLAVGLRRVLRGADVLEAEAVAGFAEGRICSRIRCQSSLARP